MAEEPKVPRTPEEKAEFEARVGEMADYANLLTSATEGVDDQEREELDAAHEQATSQVELQDRIGRIEQRAYDRTKWLWWAIGALLVAMLVAIIVFYTGRGGSSSTSGSGNGPDSGTAAETAAETAGGSSADAAAGSAADGIVSGTWILYAESKSAPFYELTFAPNGAATYLPDVAPIEYTIDSWSYTQDGDSVEIEIKQHVSDARYGVNEPSDAWFHLTLSDGVMTGTWEQDLFGYETVGGAAGTVYRSGVTDMPTTILAEPKAP